MGFHAWAGARGVFCTVRSHVHVSSNGVTGTRGPCTVGSMSGSGARGKPVQLGPVSVGDWPHYTVRSNASWVILT